MEVDNILLQAEHVSKSFGVTKALADVGFSLPRGQVLGLVGENGSGKSTLSTILAAVQSADSGSMTLDGAPYNPRSSVEASALGVCIILQENGTFSDLTVAKNIFVGQEALFYRKGFVNVQEMYREARRALDAIGAAHINEKTLVERLNFEDKKLVELARAMWSKPKVLIVDETTTALSRTGRDILYGLMEEMKTHGKSVIFISHDIDELMDKCDQLFVLRDGQYVGSLSRDEYEARKIKSMMVGRKAVENFYRTDMEPCSSTEMVMQVQNVNTEIVKDISFVLQKGEVLGFGGLADSGIHEIGRIAYGLSTPDTGSVCTADGAKVHNPKSAMALGIGYMSKNRDTESLMLASSIKDNICLPSYKKISRGCLIPPRQERNFAKGFADQLDIVMRDIDQFALELSGGNKQKIVIAKWLGFGAKILVLDCPTRGIDIGVKASIYNMIDNLRKQGISMILISEELSEIIGMCDRILIMKDGRISREFRRDEEVTEMKLVEYMV